MKIKLLAEFPLPVVCGGLELQCLRTFAALKEAGAPVGLLDYHSLESDFDTLHLFGTPPSLYEVCRFAGRSKKIVLSAVCGATGVPWLRTGINRGIAALAGAARQMTDYARIRFVFRAARAVICLNAIERTFVHRTYGVPLDRISIIPNGVAPEYFSATGELFRARYGLADFVLFTGNITARKNPLTLARALAGTRIPGVFIGGKLETEAAYAREFEQVVREAPNLTWIGALPPDSALMVSAYAAAALFCLPSRRETQPQSAMEAMACGKPVVMGDFPYARQTPFQTALRCNPDAPRSLLGCIERALSNPAAHGDRLPAAYRWDKVAKDISRVYRSIAGD